MKEKIVNKTMNYIKKNTNYDSIKLAEIKYGIEGLYLTISKLVIILILAIILGILKEVLIFLLLYNFIRMPSFGIHATKSWVCLLSSIIIFLGIPYICTMINISFKLKLIFGILGTIFMLKNSPADTKKRPIINKNRRRIYKIISTIITIIYCFLSLYVDNKFISNCFIFAITVQNIMISPITYKIFKLPYNNYINYIKTRPEYTN